MRRLGSILLLLAALSLCSPLGAQELGGEMGGAAILDADRLLEKLHQTEAMGDEVKVPTLLYLSLPMALQQLTLEAPSLEPVIVRVPSEGRPDQVLKQEPYPGTFYTGNKITLYVSKELAAAKRRQRPTGPPARSAGSAAGNGLVWVLFGLAQAGLLFGWWSLSGRLQTWRDSDPAGSLHVRFLPEIS